MRTQIKAAAIQLSGVTYWMPIPARHGDVGHAMILNGYPRPFPGGHAQGFILEDDPFVDRIAAAKIFTDAGRVLKWPPNLFSEDMW